MNSRSPAAQGALRWGAPLAATTLLAGLVPLIWRVNVNWDEFFFLSHIYDFSRGSLKEVFQTAYVHVFGWLTHIPGGELAQIVAARVAMWVLLAVTAFMIWRLARRWSSELAAPFAPLAYLAASTIDRHGDSFRADSLLVPLTVCTLLLFVPRPERARRDVAAGVCFGVALAVTVKAALLAPVLFCLAIAAEPDAAEAGRPRLAAICRRLVWFGFVAAGIAALLLALHRLSLGPVREGAAGFAARVGTTALLEVPLFPRAAYFWETARADVVSWILIALGAIGALWQRRWAAAACALSLLPIVFYRNAFPYYYVVMMAPACVLAAVGADTLESFIRRVADDAVARRTLLAMVTLLWLQGSINLVELRNDLQVGQRATLAAVHRIFPRPVPYIDHSGMVASFPKVNFFMSTWGMQEYRARGVSFMREAIDRFHAPLLLANRGFLDPQSGAIHDLLPQDQDLIRRFYLPYWGDIYVAGAEVLLDTPSEVVARFPYQGRYRLQTKMPVLIDGAPHHDGDVVDVHPDLQLHILATGITAPLRVRFYSAEARAAPKEEPPESPLYVGL